VIRRKRTSSRDIGYGLYLYFLGLSTRNVAKALSFLNIIKRSHVSIWNWIQIYQPKRASSQRNKIDEFIVDEAVIKIGSEPIWLWVAIDSKNKRILAQSISKERNMLVAEHFLSKVIEEYGKHPVSTDGGTWYPQACRFLKLKHHLHSSYEKSLIERTIQYIKDRTENFDDYFPCNKKEHCNHFHVKNWLTLFLNMHNKNILNA
jgi:putative transposase